MSLESHGRFDRKVKGGMAIVLIEWSIKPNDEAVAEFMKYWCEVAKIGDKGGLFAEFLSAPVPSGELSLPAWVDDLGSSDPKFPAWKFINVGVWRSSEDFSAQVRELMTNNLQD